MSEQDRYHREFQVPEAHADLRLDQSLAQLCPEHSRSRLSQWVKSGYVLLNGQTIIRPKEKVQGGELLNIDAPVLPVQDFRPEPMDLTLVYEDEAIIVVNKSAGLVVHPAAGNPSGTLLNGLLHHCPDLINLPRAGIVHRLDKGTTGLMVVAKTLTAHTHLVTHLQARTIKRVYHTIVAGELRSREGTVDAPIGRHPTQRIKMAVVEDGKPARTHYVVTDALDGYSILTVTLDTGRTHQIRVHMTHLGHPLLGDETYGGRKRYPRGLTPEQREAIDAFERPALHAKQLTLAHPVTGKIHCFEAAVPEDILQIQQILQKR